MKKSFLAIALCAVTLISCEKDKVTDSPENNGYMPFEEQKAVINSAIQQALQSYDMTSMAPVAKHLEFFDSQIMMVTMDSMMANPIFKQSFLRFFGKDNSGDTEDFRFKMKVLLTDSLDISEEDTTLIITPSVTCEKTNDKLNSIDIIHGENITGLKFSSFGDSFIIKKSEEGLTSISFPDSIFLAIDNNELPAYELAISKRSSKDGKLSLRLESKFDKFSSKYSIEKNADGISVKVTTSDNSSQLFSLDALLDCDMNDLSFDKNELLARLLDYSRCRGISYTIGVLNDKVRLETNLSNPTADSRIIARMLPLADMDTIPYDKAVELYNMTAPFAKSEFMFDGYRNPQAGVVLLGASEPNPTAISSTFAGVKFFSTAIMKIIEAVRAKDMTNIIYTVMSLYPGVVDTIKNFDMDSHIHVYADNANDEKYVPVDEYIDLKSIGSLIFKPLFGMFGDAMSGLSFETILSRYPMIVMKVKQYLN